MWALTRADERLDSGFACPAFEPWMPAAPQVSFEVAGEGGCFQHTRGVLQKFFSVSISSRAGDEISTAFRRRAIGSCTRPSGGTSIPEERSVYLRGGISGAWPSQYANGTAEIVFLGDPVTILSLYPR